LSSSAPPAFRSEHHPASPMAVEAAGPQPTCWKPCKPGDGPATTPLDPSSRSSHRRRELGRQSSCMGLPGIPTRRSWDLTWPACALRALARAFDPAWWQRGESNPAWTPVAASGLRRTPSRGRSPERCPASYLRVAMLPAASAGAEVPPRRCQLAWLPARSMPGLTAFVSGSPEHRTPASPGPSGRCPLAGYGVRSRSSCPPPSWFPRLIAEGAAPDGQLSLRPRFRQLWAA
jgi:hypothetical protein